MVTETDVSLAKVLAILIVNVKPTKEAKLAEQEKFQFPHTI